MAIPNRFSTQAVARYARFLELVSDNYPEVVIIDPAPLSSETFACRFRDAVKGVVQWGSGPEFKQQVEQWSGDFMVASLPGTKLLVIGSKRKVREKVVNPNNGAVGAVVDASLAPMDVLESPSDEVVRAVVTLLGYGYLGHATLKGVSLDRVNANLGHAIRPIEVMEQNGIITLL